MKLKYCIFFLATFSLISVFAQEGEEGMVENNMKAIYDKKDQEEISELKDRFDKWAYSNKKHAPFVYFSPMYQYGTGSSASANNLHSDLGIIYKWRAIKKEKWKMNIHGWLEQTSFWAGETTSDFAKKLNMITTPNASSESDHDLSLEQLMAEFFFFNQKLDVSFGKFDPLFLTTFTDYSGWDKYNYFMKSAASDPVPDISAGMGIYSEYHFTDNFSFGGIISDNDARNNYLYIPKFSNTSWNYMGFLRFKIGTGKGLYSSHNLVYYSQDAKEGQQSGSGFVYTANQGLTDNLILVLKASNGSGHIDKLNSTFVAGLTFKKPLNRIQDQAGFALVMNEKSGNYEYGIDTYYRYFINEYINVAPNFQLISTVNDKVNTVFGLRSFIMF
ncbi:hypothetical protein [Algibacter mikhailovii]|uniref:Porin n=1 Tax=Algibacter mikhailovii TaxID=425498 RepID=A0A918V5S0_9FLAO|nr:hypothetical protein [Algibacter mikhailovii]GGZ71772.1 hypothetical protein GCM10007028_06420 [Algibacter mikhailovii]